MSWPARDDAGHGSAAIGPRSTICVTPTLKSTAEIEAIARDMWGHMARLAAEYVFLDQLFDFDLGKSDPGRIEIVGAERFLRLAAETASRISSLPRISAISSCCRSPRHGIAK